MSEPRRYVRLVGNVPCRVRIGIYGPDRRLVSETEETGQRIVVSVEVADDGWVMIVLDGGHAVTYRGSELPDTEDAAGVWLGAIGESK